MALATAEMIAKDQQRSDVTCCDIITGIASLSGGVAGTLLRAKGFHPGSVPAVPLEKLNHEVMAYSVESLKALSAAVQEAAGRSRQVVGIEDMLIGILSPPSAPVLALFAEKKIDPEDLLSEVRGEM